MGGRGRGGGGAVEVRKTAEREVEAGRVKVVQRVLGEGKESEDERVESMREALLVFCRFERAEAFVGVAF